MQRNARRFDKGLAFCTDSVCCTYVVERVGEEVILRGFETEGDAAVYSNRLSFSQEQERQVRNFVRDLAESKTLPRMMVELAEEYFSSTVFD